MYYDYKEVVNKIYGELASLNHVTRDDVEFIVSKAPDCNQFVQASEDIRRVCMEFIDEFTTLASLPPTEWDGYFVVMYKIWSQAVVNHIAIMNNHMPDADKKRMMEDFKKLLFAK